MARTQQSVGAPVVDPGRLWCGVAELDGTDMCWANTAFGALLGLGSAECTGDAWVIGVDPRDRGAVVAAIRGGAPAVFRVHGAGRWVRMASSDHGRTWCAVDVTAEIRSARDADRTDVEVIELRRRLADTEEQLADTLSRLVQVGEVERRRIVDELHDTAMQQIAAALLMLDLGGDNHLATAREHLEAAVDAARALIDSICPPLLAEAGVVAALTDVFGRGGGVPVRIDAHLDTVHLSPTFESLLWRTIVDVVGAARDDPSVTSVHVHLAPSGGGLSVDVTDDGCGERSLWHPSGAPTALGAARDTVSAIGGDFQRASSTTGTTVTFSLPG